MNNDINDLIQKVISDFAAEKAVKDTWRAPLTAALPSDHPLIPSLKKSVSFDHLMPEEILPGAKSIIVFFIPYSERIIKSNEKGEAASEEWARTYLLTNNLIVLISEEIEKYLDGLGFDTGKTKPTHNFDEKTLMSRWSHRHLAYLAGLGSFGINNMLITSMGCCGRFGSLVTNAGIDKLKVQVISAPPRERCLYKRNGSCGLCQKKCVNGSYGGESFDRRRCFDVCLKNAKIHKSIGFADVCGKCLVGLPCSSGEPS